MSHICRRVRDALLAERSLWDSIAAKRVLPEAVAAFLDRSAPNGACVVLDLDVMNISHYFDTLQFHLPRVAELQLDLRLNVEFSSDPYSTEYLGYGWPRTVLQLTLDQWARLRSILCSPAPKLTELDVSNARRNDWDFYIWQEHGPEEERTIPSDLLAGDPGQLRACYFDGLQLPLPVPHALSRLTTLEYSMPVCLTTAHLHDILLCMPELQRLGLSFHYFLDPPTARAPFVHPALRNVAIYRVFDDHIGVLA